MLMSDLNSSSNDMQLQENMKSLITEEETMIEAKGKDSIMKRTYFQVVRANNIGYEAVSGDGRRNVKFDAGDVLPAEVYTRFWDEFKPRGGVWNDKLLQDVFNYFTNLDISDFDVNREMPFTRTMRCQRLLSNDKDTLILRMLLELIAEEPLHLNIKDGKLCEKTTNLYNQFCLMRNNEKETVGRQHFKRRLADQLAVQETHLTTKYYYEHCRGYMIPLRNLEEALKKLVPAYDKLLAEQERGVKAETTVDRLKLFYDRMFT